MELTEGEYQAVIGAVRGSIDLYANYVMLQPETPQMARKQGTKRKQLGMLRTALPKLIKARMSHAR